ncbi:peroxidase TAP [Punctularia strigosozonata HHB-11173 SS5]|uniref:peroxidase TAP n=1 Tax=Punctularia strigosozonata (strain HHB-11173) TaxID=741275 RepID=UPI0004417783|nr:peroxidase TAP [Punctularia strigosozonata HHB-11173 SS5]EIN09037.1 peroxidase TAP [Punctularia strigosozonata HHB-11173 SS5]
MQYSRLLAFTLLAVANVSGVFGATAAQPALKPRQSSVRTTPLLKNFKGQPALPSLASVQATNATGSALDLANIQGDIFVGMKKPVENFYFFHINDAAQFKADFKTQLSIITSAATLISPPADQPAAYVNVGFSQSGLTALGVTDDLGDADFSSGQFAQAAALKDDTTQWEPEFKGTNIHGVFLVGSDVGTNIQDTFNDAIQELLKSATIVYELDGAARPGAEAGHEHFGYLDGISNPGVDGFTTDPKPGQSVVDAGIILTGEDGDSVTRPAWALDGSFLAFRKLKQLVPEYKKWLLDNAVQSPAGNLTQQEGADLLGARIFGRWPSGAPIDLTPLADDPALGADPSRNNDFDFSHPDSDITSDQSHCPFAAHIRKTRPRADLNNANVVNQAIRAGIPYGPEVTADESASNTTSIDRGLAFVMYQSNIGNGFQFQQTVWVDNQNFIFGKNISSVGLDMVIGQPGAGLERSASGFDPTDFDKVFTQNPTIISNGGEYFFVPSISALNNTILA